MLLAACLLSVGHSLPARAACNLIPQTTNTFDSALGSTNRPYAAPGEPIELRVRPCDTASTSPAGFIDPPANYHVTVVFTPAGFAHNAVILSSNCAFFTLGVQTACEAQLGGATATCVPVMAGPGQDIDVVSVDGEPHLRFRFPATDDFVGMPSDGRMLAGAATIAITKASDPLPCDLASVPCRGHAGLVACVDDFFTNDGACGTRVPAPTFRHFIALPPVNDFVADCFAESPPCSPSATEVRLVGDVEGNLLVPVNWTGILVRQAGVPVPRLLSNTVAPPFPITVPGKSFLGSYTPEGGLLPPIFEPQFDPRAAAGIVTLFGSADAPYTVLRVARRSETFQQCTGGYNDGGPCNSNEDCPGACANDATRRCTADADCVSSTCNPAGTCGPATCAGGSNPGALCNTDDNCPDGECGPEAYPLASVQGLVDSGVGAVRLQRFGPFTSLDPGICQLDTTDMCTVDGDCNSGSTAPCVRYAITAQNPVPLEGFAESQNLLAFTVNETIDGQNLNNDNDSLDSVLTLRNRDSGQLVPLGAADGFAFGGGQLAACGLTGTPEGRAVTRNQVAPFSFPAVATEGDVLAFLESEANQNAATGYGCDENGDFDRFDSILRVFKLAGTELATATCRGGGNDGLRCVAHSGCSGGDCVALAADAAPVLNNRSVVVSDGQVFYRHSEGAQARGVTDRVSLSNSDAQGNGDSSGLINGGSPALSADGRFVAFPSAADNLVTGDTNGVYDIFVRDRCIANGRAVSGCTTTTTRVSVDSSGAQDPSNESIAAAISADGRFVLFNSAASSFVAMDTNGANDVFLRDRCLSNGVPVGGCTVTTERVSLAADGTEGNGASASSSGLGRPISEDGRFVGFLSFATNLVLGDGNGVADIFVRDRCLSHGNPVPNCTSTTRRVSVDSNGTEANGNSDGAVMSADGRFVAFRSDATNLVANDMNAASDIFVHDLQTGATERVSISSNGAEANDNSFNPSISADGRFVAFQGPATNLAPGATNGAQQVFVHDRLTGATELASRNSDGIQGNNISINAVISDDGRFVAMATIATDLFPNDTNGAFDIAVYNRTSGLTEVASVSSTGTLGNDQGGFFNSSPALSADGRTAVFAAASTNLIVGDTNGKVDVYVHSLDPTDTGSDLTGDGDLDDSVLEVLDSTGPTVTALCPTRQVAVAAGSAAFLRPEAAGATPKLPACPTGPLVAGNPDLNGNGVASDAVVHYASGGIVQNLERAATAVALSALCTGGTKDEQVCTTNADCPSGSCAASYVAALVSEAGQLNTDPNGLNGDGDLNDNVVGVHKLTDPPTTWTNAKQAADALQAAGGLVVFITPEAAQDKDLNGDGDKQDRVVHMYDAVAGKLIKTGQAAEEFVIGSQNVSCGTSQLVAFRTSEAAQGHTDLNNVGQNVGAGDGDTSDFVLQVYATGLGVVNSHQAVTPCRLEACDPQAPYKVFGDSVRFITYEAEQGQDLNGDGDMTDLILQVFDACTGTVTVVGTVDPSGGGVIDPVGQPPGGGGVLPSPAKRCLATLGSPPSCSSDADCTAVTPGSFCLSGTCRLPIAVPPTCQTNTDCPAGSTCEDDQIVGTVSPPSSHDSVVLPRRALTVKIPAGDSAVTKTFKVKVGNADVSPAREIPGHRVRLTVQDGTCSQGTVAGVPDLDKAAPGAQDNVLLAGGKSVTAVVPLHVVASAFTTYNKKAPARCTLLLTASTVLAGNVDPHPRNDVLPLELNVIDQNDPGQSVGPTTHESVIQSARPRKLRIGSSGSALKTVRVAVINADILPAPEVGHDITVTAGDGDCPAGTVGTVSPATITVAGGARGKVEVPITVNGADFATPNKKTPGRCTAVLTATTDVMGNTEPDVSNNTTNLVIDVIDKKDLP